MLRARPPTEAFLSCPEWPHLALVRPSFDSDLLIEAPPKASPVSSDIIAESVLGEFAISFKLNVVLSAQQARKTCCGTKIHSTGLLMCILGSQC